MTRSGIYIYEGKCRMYGLNPSFSGWPALGQIIKESKKSYRVLIPLLVDDPLWDVNLKSLPEGNSWVLIPLLVDDPLWD